MKIVAKSSVVGSMSFEREDKQKAHGIRVKEQCSSAGVQIARGRSTSRKSVLAHLSEPRFALREHPHERAESPANRQLQCALRDQGRTCLITAQVRPREAVETRSRVSDSGKGVAQAMKGKNKGKSNGCGRTRGRTPAPKNVCPSRRDRRPALRIVTGTLTVPIHFGSSRGTVEENFDGLFVSPSATR